MTLNSKFICRILDRNDLDYEKRVNQLFKLRFNDMIRYYNENVVEDGIDKDEYDEFCDHAVVIDSETDDVVGTYRFITSEHINNLNNKFLLESEFNIDDIKKKGLLLLEVGRAVVQEDYRDGSVITLLWKLALVYAINNNIDVMIGTVSFHGTDPKVFEKGFKYLIDNYQTSYDVYAINDKYDITLSDEVDKKEALHMLPPLVKGYMRMGSKFARNVFIDYNFKSVDMLVLTTIKLMDKRYLEKFSKL